MAILEGKASHNYYFKGEKPNPLINSFQTKNVICETMGDELKYGYYDYEFKKWFDTTGKAITVWRWYD